MKAITLWQPWASLVRAGLKSIETRSWDTKHRGLLAIHAGKKHVAGILAELMEQARMGRDWRDWYAALLKPPLGAVVAVGFLVRTWRTEAIEGPIVDHRNHAFGDFSSGRFAWELINLHGLKDPVQVKGRQGIWQVPVEVEARILRQIQPGILLKEQQEFNRVQRGPWRKTAGFWPGERGCDLDARP